VIASLQGRETGLRDHGELIRVHAVPLRSLWRLSADCKVLGALALTRTGSGKASFKIASSHIQHEKLYCGGSQHITEKYSTVCPWR